MATILKDFYTQLGALISERDELLSNEASLERSVDLLRTAIEASNSELAIKKSRIAELEADAGVLQKRIAWLEGEIRALKDAQVDVPVPPEPEPEPTPEPVPTPVPEPAPSTIPDIAFDQHQISWPPPDMPLPEVGKWVSDPVFGTSIMRLPDGVRHIYSQLQPFNSDNTEFLGYDANKQRHGILKLDGTSGGFTLYSSSSPRYANGWILDIQRDKIKIADQSALYADGEIFTSASWEMPDARGEYVAFVDRAEKVTVLRLADLKPMYSFKADDGINWVRVSPAGPDHGVIIQYNNSRTLWYNKDGSVAGTICRNNRHSDVRAYGDGFRYVYQEDYVGGAENALVAIDSTDLSKKVVLAKTNAWDRIGHNSCTGPDEVCSAGMNHQGNKELLGEIWMVRQDGSIRRVCHHRSSMGDYWMQPQAAQSSDGRYLAFASDWGTGNYYGFICDLNA